MWRCATAPVHRPGWRAPSLSSIDWLRRPLERVGRGGYRHDGGNREVGLIGGVAQKAITVRRAGVQVFLVPKANLPFHAPSGLRVIGVSSLDEALAELGRLGRPHIARRSS